MKVIKTNNDEYILKTDNRTVYCSNADKLISLMRKEGISFEQIEVGLTEMIKKDHNVANFGIGVSNKGICFLFSEKV